MNDVPSYNGWSNPETWLASLWLTNDEASYEVILAAKQHAKTTYGRAEWLKRALREQLEAEAGEASLWCDLLNTAFARIDWVEVIEHNQ